MIVNFMRYIKIVEAFQMTPEQRISNADWPSWLHEAWQRPRETDGALFPTVHGYGDGTLSFGVDSTLVCWDDWFILDCRRVVSVVKDQDFKGVYLPN